MSHHDPEYKFCPVCGGRLDSSKLKANEPRRPVCPSCHFVLYLDPKVVACSILEMDSKIVLLRRGINPQKGKWVMPGGYVDRGEEVKTAAIRETEEECGVKTRINRLLGVYSYSGQVPVVIVYITQYLSGDLIPGDETLETRLFSERQIPWDNLAFISTVNALKDYYATKNDGGKTQEMEIKPQRIEGLSPEKRETIMERSMEDISSIYEDVRQIVDDIKNRGDAVALEHYLKHKHDIAPPDLEVTKEEISAAYKQVETKVVDCLKMAAQNIIKFHEAQLEREMWSIEVREGILAGRITRAMDIVGCYIPGGTAVYPSSVLMTVLPARVAGVSQIVAVTPPGKGMVANPATLVAADIAGCDRIFKIGGPWGIAGLAYGTEAMPRVDKIVGPGNKYVTAAKMLVYGQVDIDSPAGPSESLILADHTGDPKLITWDFLSQVEHDPDSAAVLVTPIEKTAEEVCEIINREYDSLPRKEIFESSLTKHSYVLIAKDMEQAIDFTNEYAAEHLQILTKDPFITLNKIKHAGSIFLGPYAPVPVGDYASGTNHVLPTGQCARMFSGLSVDDFIKKPTFQYLSKKGLAGLKDIVVTLAEAEGLPMHARAVKARFE